MNTDNIKYIKTGHSKRVYCNKNEKKPSETTGATKLINSDLFLEKRATVPIKTQGVQRSSSGKMSTF